MTLTNEQLTSFSDAGCTIDGELLDEEHRTAVMATLLRLLVRLGDASFDAFQPSTALDDPRFHHALIDLRATAPKRFGAIYDSIQTSTAVGAIVHDRRLVERAAALLHVGPDELMAHSQVLRMDVPEDRRNLLDWHYDYFVNDPTHACEAGVTAWIPLQDVTEAGGGVEIALGSHRLSLAGDAPVPRPGELASETFDLDVERIEQLPRRFVEARARDVVWFPMRLVHRGTSNRSDRVRFTCLARYYAMTADDFRPGRHVYQPSPA